MDDISESYRILEVRADASLEEVKRAYRELARVWHPDRFGSDVRLQQKAQEKLKQINLAYERICSRGAYEPRRPTSSTTGPTPQPRQQTPPPPQWTPPKPSPQSSRSEPPKTQSKSWFWGPAGPPKIDWGKVVLFLITAALISLFVIARTSTESTSSTIPAATSTPARQPDIFDQLAQSRAASPRPSINFVPENSVAATPTEIRRAEPVNEMRQSPYFTIGSTKDDVLRIQGSPDRFTDGEFWYGTSEVYFEGNRVTSWSNRYPRLKVQLLPRHPVTASQFYTIGSTKDQVLAVQGPPDRFTDREFWYGTSEVYFEGNRVTSWSNRYPRLKAQLLPRAGTVTPQFFTVGSTKDEVLAVQGSPDRFTDGEFWYGTSEVYFEGNRVTSWSNRYPRLKASLRPTSPYQQAR
jgi:DnaJ-like protein